MGEIKRGFEDKEKVQIQLSQKSRQGYFILSYRLHLL